MGIAMVFEGEVPCRYNSIMLFLFNFTLSASMKIPCQEASWDMSCNLCRSCSMVFAQSFPVRCPKFSMFRMDFLLLIGDIAELRISSWISKVFRDPFSTVNML